MSPYRKILLSIYLASLGVAISYACYLYKPFIAFPAMAAFLGLCIYLRDRHVKQRTGYPYWEHTDAIGLMIIPGMPIFIISALLLLDAAFDVMAWKAISPFAALLVLGILIVHYIPEDTSACHSCKKGQAKQGPNRCPECGKEFNDKWSGMASHWNANHKSVMPYEKVMASLCSAHRKRVP